jgi:hypothetical protein
MAQDEGVDTPGERGGDTGETKPVGRGPQAEKGDARRKKQQHSGPTRPGKKKRNPVITSGHAGSDKTLHDDHPTT